VKRRRCSDDFTPRPFRQRDARRRYTTLQERLSASLAKRGLRPVPPTEAGLPVGGPREGM
jgi:hypothetical protein